MGSPITEIITENSPPPAGLGLLHLGGPVHEVGGMKSILAVAASPTPSDFATTVQLAFGGTALLGTNFSIAGAGYNPATQSVVIPAGVSSVQLTVTSIYDKTFGPPQISSTIAIASAQNADPAGNPATIVFTQGDPAPVVTLGPATLSIPELSGTGIITATLSAASLVNTIVTLGRPPRLLQAAYAGDRISTTLSQAASWTAPP